MCSAALESLQVADGAVRAKPNCNEDDMKLEIPGALNSCQGKLQAACKNRPRGCSQEYC